MNLSAFIPSIIISKGGDKKGKTLFSDKYKHYNSISNTYIEVEEFLDASIHATNPELIRLKKKRDSAVKRIELIRDMVRNNDELEKRVEEKLDNLWATRKKRDEKMHLLLGNMPENFVNYGKIQRIVERARRAKKSISSHGYISNFFQTIDLPFRQKLESLYQLNRKNQDEILELVIEADLGAKILKRLALVLEQVSSFYLDCNEKNFTEVHVRRFRGVIELIINIQTESLLEENDIQSLERHIDTLTKIPDSEKWNPTLDEHNRFPVSSEAEMENFDNPNISKELAINFENPGPKYYRRSDLILYDDERIFTKIAPVEDRVALKKWQMPENMRPSMDDLQRFLLAHTKAVPNCRIQATSKGVFYLTALKIIGIGEILRSEMAPFAFITWMGFSMKQDVDEVEDKIQEKILTLERALAVLAGKNDYQTQLERVDLNQRRLFLKKLKNI